MTTIERAEMRAEWEAALTRAARYELLVLAFRYPGDDMPGALDRVGPVVASITTGDPALDGPVETLLHALDRPVTVLRAAHAEVFTHIEPTDCPPYESAYSPADVFRQTEVMADVAGFYRAHGLVVGGSERERPDHIVTELEFASFMARKEAHALEHLGADEVEECRRTSARFLSDHLGCWGPGFGRRVALVASDLALRGAGELLVAWLEADMEALGVAPTEHRSEPAPRPAPEDDTCGAACFDACVPVESPGVRP